MTCSSSVFERVLAGCILVTAIAACGSPPLLSDAGAGFDASVSIDATRPDSATTRDTSATDVPPSTDAAPLQVRFPPALCADPVDDAPILNGSGGHICTRVGADRTVATGTWPDLSREAAPYVYVSVSAGAGGDGSAGRPFATISEALSASHGRTTIVVGAGRYHLPTTIIVNGAVTFVGAGAGGAPDDRAGGDAGVADGAVGSDAGSDAGGGDGGVPVGTTLVASASGPAIRIVGSTANATLSRIQILGEVPGMGTGIAVEDGALLTLRDIEIRDLETGIDVRTTAVVRASRLSIGPVAQDGIALRSGSSADLNAFNVRRCGGAGILAHDSGITLREGMVSETAGGGLLLVGSSPSGTDSIDRLVVRANRIAGVAAAALAGVSGISRHVDFTLTSITGTTTGVGAVGGYGVFIGRGIDAHFDPFITTDARRGMGSEFLVNAHAGLLVSGTDATLELDGARFGSNFGPGLMLQSGATGSRVGYSEFVDNRGAGAIITSGASLAYFVCNESSQNVQAPLQFTLRTAVFGDGLLVAPGGAMPSPLELEGNHLNHNARFGAYFAGATINVGLGNEATGNGDSNAGRDDTTLTVGMTTFIPVNLNFPPGTNLPQSTDTLPDVSLM